MALTLANRTKTTTGLKLYKGIPTTLEKFAKEINGPTAVQTIDTAPKDPWGYTYNHMPNCFVVLKVEVTEWGDTYVHYFDSKSGNRTYRTMKKDTELNILTGTHGAKLLAEWYDAAAKNLSGMGRRLVCTLGTDPEIFAVDGKGQVVPAWTYLPNKEKPIKHKLHGWNGTAYWDGFQAEFTTQGTQTCLLQVSDNIQGGLKKIHEAAKEVGGKLTIETVLPVDPDFLQGETLEHVQFGCAPSWNVYGLRGNIEDGRNVPFRFAGGHLHFGLSRLTKEPEKRQQIIEKYVRALDKVLAVAVVSLLGELDNPIRRRFYGQPGEYRMPAHGFEYRVLSNAWLCHPLAFNMVFDLARSVCGLEEEDLLMSWKGTGRQKALQWYAYCASRNALIAE